MTYSQTKNCGGASALKHGAGRIEDETQEVVARPNSFAREGDGWPMLIHNPIRKRHPIICLPGHSGIETHRTVAR